MLPTPQKTLFGIYEFLMISIESEETGFIANSHSFQFTEMPPRSCHLYGNMFYFWYWTRGGGGTRPENWWGCAAGRWKLDPKRSRKKLNLGPKRSIFVKIGSFCTPRDSFAVGGWEKVPQKDRARSCPPPPPPPPGIEPCLFCCLFFLECHCEVSLKYKMKWNLTPLCVTHYLHKCYPTCLEMEVLVCRNNLPNLTPVWQISTYLLII